MADDSPSFLSWDAVATSSRLHLAHWQARSLLLPPTWSCSAAVQGSHRWLLLLSGGAVCCSGCGSCWCRSRRWSRRSRWRCGWACSARLPSASAALAPSVLATSVSAGSSLVDGRLAIWKKKGLEMVCFLVQGTYLEPGLPCSALGRRLHFLFLF